MGAPPCLPTLDIGRLGFVAGEKAPREFWRYYFAGQIAAGSWEGLIDRAESLAVGVTRRDCAGEIVRRAHALLAALESSPAAPSGPLDTDGEEEGRG